MGLAAQRARCSGTGKPAQAVAAYARQSDSLMVIHHGNAQETQLQATELRSRLTSLAVDSTRILLLADLPANDRLSIEIRTTK
ncbi:MAG TPA: hypothetical protein VHE58_10270 [Burkholderiales bacterium]|nr:hypothetical protein [Burkholderiales bacterium]